VVALCLGAAVLALGFAPHAVAALGAAPAAGGFLLLVLAESVGAPVWVSRLSPFAHLAPVPLSAPDWIGATAMMAIAAALGFLGLAGYRRRDQRG
jgi:ABC-2 type transport system permease protein